MGTRDAGLLLARGRRCKGSAVGKRQWICRGWFGRRGGGRRIGQAGGDGAGGDAPLEGVELAGDGGDGLPILGGDAIGGPDRIARGTDGAVDPFAGLALVAGLAFLDFGQDRRSAAPLCAVSTARTAAWRWRSR